ncbi:MAG: hypothetical protein EXS14_04400 [Planctomycetes bacterium]|nr:hypothetical protein [Planctomycetota bacterium]
MAIDGAQYPVLVDGDFLVSPTVALGVRDPALNAGEGLYETMLVLRGHAPLLQRHLGRLLASAHMLGLPAPPSAELLSAEVGSVVTRMSHGSGLLRVVLLHDSGRTRRLIVSDPLPADRMLPAQVGLAARAFQGPRPLAAHKTLNNLQARLAHLEGASRGLDEVLFTLPDGAILEGTRSSVFLVKGGALFTAPLSLPILPGITREVLLELARREGIPCHETPFTVQDLHGYSEAFISGSVRGVRALASFEGTPLANVDGPTTCRLRAAYSAFLG